MEEVRKVLMDIAWRCKRRRRRLVKLRGGTAELEVETGRWRGVRREEGICKNCRGGGCWTFGDEMYICGRGKGEAGGADELEGERTAEYG